MLNCDKTVHRTDTIAFASIKFYFRVSFAERDCLLAITIGFPVSLIHSANCKIDTIDVQSLRVQPRLEVRQVILGSDKTLIDLTIYRGDLMKR